MEDIIVNTTAEIISKDDDFENWLIKNQSVDTIDTIKRELNSYSNEAKKLLQELTKYRKVKKKLEVNGQKIFSNEKSSQSLIKAYSSQLSNRQQTIVLNTMKRAYLLIMKFREYVLKQKIEYLIGFDTGSSLRLDILTTEQVLQTVTLGTSSGGGLKLNVSGNEIQKLINAQKTEQIVNQELLNKVTEALMYIKECNTAMSRKEFFEKAGEKYKGKNGDKDFYINEGYALEAALVQALDNNIDKLRENIPARYQAYLNAIKNTTVFRAGGDLGKELTGTLKALEKTCQTLQIAAELQVKRVAANSSAQLVTLNSLVYELSSIILLVKAKPQQLEKFFKDQKKSKDYFGTLKKTLTKELRNDPDIKFVLETLKSFTKKQK
jgi:hypothetical protein